MGKNLLLGVLASMFLVCCHTAGSKYDTGAIDRIGVGQTTDREVLSMMGGPLSERKLSNGIKVYNYAYGNRCPLSSATSVNSAELLFYNGVVINKWQELMKY
jgi:hypothetical protein